MLRDLCPLFSCIGNVTARQLQVSKVKFTTANGVKKIITTHIQKQYTESGFFTAHLIHFAGAKRHSPSFSLIYHPYPGRSI